MQFAFVYSSLCIGLTFSGSLWCIPHLSQEMTNTSLSLGFFLGPNFTFSFSDLATFNCSAMQPVSDEEERQPLCKSIVIAFWFVQPLV